MTRLDFMHSPPNEAAITELYAFLSLDDTGEGVVATILPGLGSTQLITGRERVADKMKAFAQQIASESGKKVRLVRFTRAPGESLWEST